MACLVRMLGFSSGVKQSSAAETPLMWDRSHKLAFYNPEERMNQQSGVPLKKLNKLDQLNKRDYSCEIISVVVLVLLSALSHFWYIAIAAAFAIAAWQTIRLLGLAVRSASAARMLARLLNN